SVTAEPSPICSDKLFAIQDVAAPATAAAVYCDLDPVGGASSNGVSATFGDTILAAALSSGATGAVTVSAGTKGGLVVAAGASPDAEDGDAFVDGSPITRTEGASCECGTLTVSPYMKGAEIQRVEKALPAQEEDAKNRGGSERSPEGCLGPASSNKSIRSVPIQMVQESSGTHASQVVLPVLSAPLDSALSSSCGVCPPGNALLHGPQAAVATDALDPDCDPRVRSQFSVVRGCMPGSITSYDDHPSTSVETGVATTIDYSEGSVVPTVTYCEGEVEAPASRPPAPEAPQLPAVAGASTPAVGVAFHVPFGVTEAGAGAAASSNAGPKTEGVQADVHDAAPQQGALTADPRLLMAATGSGASGDVLDLWGSSVVNTLITGSEPGAAGVGLTFDTSISSGRSCNVATGATSRLPTPADVAAATAAAAAAMGAGPGASFRQCSPLSMNAANARNKAAVAALDAAVSAAASQKMPLDGGSETEGPVDTVVPGQEDWSIHRAREASPNLQDGGSVLEESSCLINTDNNFSIEFAAHNLRAGSVLQGRRSIGGSLPRANTAGQNGSQAGPRALAYIDEENTGNEGIEELSFLLPKVMPYPTPYVAPRLTDPNIDNSLAPAIERVALPASMPVPTAKRPLTPIRDSLAERTAPVSEVAMHILGNVPAAASSPSRSAARADSKAPQPSSTSRMPALPGLQLNRAGAVRSNPPFMSRIVRRDVIAAGGAPAASASAAAMITSNSFPSGRGTTTYLQHIGQDESKRLRAVLKALVNVASTDVNAANSGSNAVTMGGHASAGSCAFSRASCQPSGNALGGAATRCNNLISAPLSKLTCDGCGDMLLDGMAAESDPAAAGIADTRRGQLSPLGTDATRWHEVHVRPCFDPMSSEPLTMVIQTDVTSKVRAEKLLARVLEAEHRLLADIFPRHVVHYMTQRRKDAAELERNGLTLLRHIQDPAAVATLHDNVTVLFADIKGFTEMSKEVAPAVVMTFLNDLYTRFDSLTDVYGVYKVETIGDCYMVAGGLVARDGDGYGPAVRGQGDTDPLHAMRVLAFARAMLEEAAKVALPSTGEPVQVRVGMHSGSVMSGVVGQKMPRFCLFGDTINTASRMESTGRPGAIHISCATRHLLPPEEDEELWAPTGGVEVKGKGRMDTYLWSPQSPAASRQRRDKQQRAMLLGTLSTLQPPSPSVSPPSSNRLVIGRVGAGGGCNGGVSASGALSNQIQILSGSGASLSRVTCHTFDPSSTLC
ncbi:hypothetical protein Vretifemale_10317, partial [Volvox reticuliferus]